MNAMREYTRYEKARIISSRALQIAQGAPILVKIPKGMTDPKEIAKLEWNAGVIPIEIKKKAA
jgi:DNA-directed RNA polymerase subunit K/omega